jgi:hypothetical protein
VARKNSRSIFNPEAVYQVDARGMWVENLVDAATKKKTGPILLPAGTTVYYDAKLVNISQDDFPSQ